MKFVPHLVVALPDWSHRPRVAVGVALEFEDDHKPSVVASCFQAHRSYRLAQRLTILVQRQRAEHLAALGNDEFHHRDEELLLAFEVRIDGPLGPSGLAGDSFELRSFVSVLNNDSLRRAEQCGLREIALLLELVQRVVLVCAISPAMLSI